MESVGSEGLKHVARREILTQKDVNLIINVGLLGLVVCAWAAQKYPEYSDIITGSIVAGGLLIWGICHIFRIRTDEKKADVSLENHEDSSTYLIGKQLEIFRGPDGVHYAHSSQDRPTFGGVYEGQKADFIEVIDNEKRVLHRSDVLFHENILNESYLTYLQPQRGRGRVHSPHMRLSPSLVDVKPADVNNYTVKVGLVKIEVKDGVAEVSLGGKMAQQDLESEFSNETKSSAPNEDEMPSVH